MLQFRKKQKALLFILSLVFSLFLSNCSREEIPPIDTSLVNQNKTPATTVTQAVNQPSLIASQQKLGTNISGLAYWSTQWVFVDLMKQGSEWANQNVTPGGPLDTKMIDSIPLDENGYPLEIPFTPPNGVPQKVMIATTNYSYPRGEYLLLFDGEGEISVFGKGVSFRKEGPGRYLITRGVNGEEIDRINITITKSVKGNHIRNMRLIMPGFADNYQEQIFHPLFLERLQGFSVLRFVDLMYTNNSNVVTWENRNTPSTYTQTRGRYGMAPEYIAELVNRTEADAWINIPHQADDNYIRELAKLLQEKLEPTKKIYVEYSNELWNAQFKQTQWLWEKGCQDIETFKKAQNGECDKGLSGVNFHAKRLAQIAQIFDEVFQDGFKERIIIVAASQAISPYLSEQLLKAFDNNTLNPQGYQPAALAIAPYFSLPVADLNAVDENITVEELLDKSQRYIESNFLTHTLKQKEIADKYNVSLITYEGGQHLAPLPKQRKEPIINAMIEANRNPRMGDLYREYFKSWYEKVGGGLFMNYSYVGAPSQYGSWGVLEYQDQPIEEAPKYQAILDTFEYLRQKQ